MGGRGGAELPGGLHASARGCKGAGVPSGQELQAAASVIVMQGWWAAAELALKGVCCL